MRKQITLFILLLFSVQSFAQKKPIKKSTKVEPKQVATKLTTETKVVIIPDNYPEIKKLLDNGEISIDAAYNSQIKIINEIVRGIFNKRLETENLNQTVFAVENPFLFNFYDRSLSIVFSSGISDSKVVEIFPKINLFEIKKVQIIKKALGEVEFVIINPNEKNEYVSIKNEVEKPEESQSVAFLIIPADNQKNRNKIIEAFKNLILLLQADNLYNNESFNKGSLTATTIDNEEELIISFDRTN